MKSSTILPQLTISVWKKAICLRMTILTLQIQSVLCGVPQGSVLGPLLFVILMNDLETVLDKCKIILYADDTVLSTSNNDMNLIVSELNHDLKLMAKLVLQ